MKTRRRAALEGVWVVGGWEESKRRRRAAAAGTSSRRLKRLFGKEERALWRTKPKHGANTVWWQLVEARPRWPVLAGV